MNLSQLTLELQLFPQNTNKSEEDANQSYYRKYVYGEKLSRKCYMVDTSFY